MQNTITGTLDPRSNDTVEEMRFTGGFGLNNGFDSVLVASMRRNGEACLTLHFTQGEGTKLNHLWSVMLTSEQRKELAALLIRYEPRLFESTLAANP